jgi:hypothetical protein
VTTCAIHQPNLFPRASTLAKLLAADVWIVLDNVQFNRRDYQHRARLASVAAPERGQWLTIPVHRPQGRATLIDRILIADQQTTARRLTALTAQYYRRAPHWHLVRDLVTTVADLTARTARLAEVTERSTQVLLDLLGWSGSTIRASTLPARPGRSTRLADLTHAVGATTYLCGPGGATYLDEEPFAQHGVTIKYTDHTRSRPRMSALHALALTGTIT